MSLLSTIKYLKDYQAPDFLIKGTNLDFQILDNKIIVNSLLFIEKKNPSVKDLQLDGHNLLTKQVCIDDRELVAEQDFSFGVDTLTIFKVPDVFILKTCVEIDPYNNSSLMGIYKSHQCLCSQCEPEGFRNITWYIDRPDIMSLWTVSISANIYQYPTLLSNGNLIFEETKDDIKTCVFQDPFAKPCYLFALVAGEFDQLVTTINTKNSNKTVKLQIFVEPGKKHQAYFALESLKKAIYWDEDYFNLEYDLDVFSIVAVRDFNAGAMENKGLNIFNDVYILADPTIATDNDYFNIESIIAHEYFHNYTGNRVTCRDWFQLTLKEGLTIYRDHLFSETMHDSDIVRINNVELLKNHQFLEDQGPLAHPIRPTQYSEINNFYTSTVYQKGSEVIRMIDTLIGKENFKQGIQIYFDNFDSQAVTCEDFIWSMEQACGYSLNDFFQCWYHHKGTPEISLNVSFDAQKATIDILQQGSVHDSSLIFVIPLKLAFFDHHGQQLAFSLNANNQQFLTEAVYKLTKQQEKLEIYFKKPLTNTPSLSINREFAAPCIIHYEQNNQDLINLSQYDTDGFSQHESWQKYLKTNIINMINDILNNENQLNVSQLNVAIQEVLQPLAVILNRSTKQPHLTALLLKLPTISYFESYYKHDFPLEIIHQILTLYKNNIALLYNAQFIEIIHNTNDNEEIFNTSTMSQRALLSIALFYIMQHPEHTILQHNQKIIQELYFNTSSMTKKIAVLNAVKDTQDHNFKEYIFNDFYHNYQQHHTVVNKWFLLSALSDDVKIIDKITRITQLPEFSFNNPNNVRSLFAGLMMNHLAFHNIDNSGYTLIHDMIIKMDSINNHVSCYLAKGFAKIINYDIQRRNMVKIHINNILQNQQISKGLVEILQSINNQLTS